MTTTPHQIHNKLLTVVTQNKINFLEQGRLLYELRDNYNFREAIGSGIDSWHEYLAQPEIGMSPTQANKLLHIYELFIKKLHYNEEEIIKIPIKTLNYIIKRQEEFEKISKDKQEEIINQAQVLSHKDFKEAYFDEINKKESGQVIRTLKYVLMQKCLETGNMTIVHAIPSDELEMFVNKMKEQND